MALFPYKRVKVADGLYIRQSQYFCYTDFGVRGGGRLHYSGRYVNTGVPGTGFIERGTESYSYQRFVRRYTVRQRPRYWRLLLGLEPSYDKELQRAKAALLAADEPLKRQILDCYVNALTIGRAEEQIERVMRGVKNKSHHGRNRYYVSVMSHYKGKMRQLEHDMTAVELDLRDTCTAVQYEAYCRMVERFATMAACRRIWFLDEDRSERFVQVFFDLGVFDFIHGDTLIPVMRDSRGVHYYLLPTHILVARSSVDFDLLPLADVTVVWQELAIQETIEVISSRLGDAASMVRLPGLGLTWYFNHVHPIMHFVEAYDKLRSLQ